MEPEFNLKTTKPKDLKAEDFKEQICMRCAKRPAMLKEIFCFQCLEDRAEIDKIISKKNPDEVPKKTYVPFLDDAKVEE